MLMKLQSSGDVFSKAIPQASELRSSLRFRQVVEKFVDFSKFGEFSIESDNRFTLLLKESLEIS